MAALLLLLPLPLEAAAAAAMVKGVVAVAGDLCSVRGSSGGDGVSGMREEEFLAVVVAGMAGVGGEKKVEVEAEADGTVEVDAVGGGRDEGDRDGGSGGGRAGVGTVSGSKVSVCGKATRARVLRSSVA